jgi:hypothetical protein
MYGIIKVQCHDGAIFGAKSTAQYILRSGSRIQEISLNHKKQNLLIYLTTG